MSVRHVKNRPIVLGLTGGIASGKSIASHYLESLRIPVIDSDQIVKDLWLKDHDMLDRIESVFHTLDKKTIAQTIFSDDTLRLVLNQIVHPYVFDEINRELKSLRDEVLVVIDMPLLFEVGYQDQVDYTAVVYVDEETALKRLIQRDGLSEFDAKARIHAQIPINQKCDLSDYVLDNTKSETELYKQIDLMLGKIKDEEQFDL